MYGVLVPFDPDEDRARAQAEAVLELPDVAESVEVTLLYVVRRGENLSDQSFVASTVDAGSPVGTRVEAGSDGTIEGNVPEPMDIPAGSDLYDRLTDAGVDVRVVRRVGDPATEIISVAEEFAVDQIVLGGRKRSPLGSLVFGSVTQSVILDARRPVTVTGSDVKREPSHRCGNCGEAYYGAAGTEIDSCRRCGGTEVAPLEGS